MEVPLPPPPPPPTPLLHPGILQPHHPIPTSTPALAFTHHNEAQPNSKPRLKPKPTPTRRERGGLLLSTVLLISIPAKIPFLPPSSFCFSFLAFK
jgi:hypothetical protein